MGWSIKKPFNIGSSNLFKVALAAIAPGASSYMSTQETNAQNAKAIQEQNRLNAENWDKQTLYNSPAEHMKRLEAAGLNPNLAYGQIAESKMASAPAMEAPHYQAAPAGESVMQTLAAYQQVLNNQELNKKIRLDNMASAQEYNMREYEYNSLKKRGQTRHDAGIIKEILGALDLLTRAGSVARDRSPSDFEHLKKDTR